MRTSTTTLSICSPIRSVCALRLVSALPRENAATTMIGVNYLERVSIARSYQQLEVASCLYLLSTTTVLLSQA
eukprot:6188861-Pleurochrysis_carterae.AAC.2